MRKKKSRVSGRVFSADLVVTDRFSHSPIFRGKGMSVPDLFRSLKALKEKLR